MVKQSLILVFIFFQIGEIFGQTDWKLVREEEGIKVFSSAVPLSRVKALKVVCELKTTPARLVALLLDVSVQAAWVYHTKSCSLVQKVSPSELYYYSEVSLPWPLDNRDFVAHVKVSQDPVTKVVTVAAPAVPGHVPEKKGIVRINHSRGHWVITPVTQDKIKLEYTLQVDPGGIIPAWAVNMFSSQGPVETFKNMRVRLGEAK